MAAGRLLKSSILTWERITALQIRWTWLTSSPWAVWWPPYLFAVRQIHSVDIEFLLWALSVWCGCSRTRYHCRVRDLENVKTQNPLGVGGEILIPNKVTPTSKEEAGLKNVYVLIIYYIIIHGGTVVLSGNDTFLTKKHRLRLKKIHNSVKACDILIKSNVSERLWSVLFISVKKKFFILSVAHNDAFFVEIEPKKHFLRGFTSVVLIDTGLQHKLFSYFVWGIYLKASSGDYRKTWVETKS